jgi:hypothetical protein
MTDEWGQTNERRAAESLVCLAPYVCHSGWGMRAGSIVGESPLPLPHAGRTFSGRTISPRARKAAKSLRSIAALQNVAAFARGCPNRAPAFWSAVVGASPLPL